MSAFFGVVIQSGVGTLPETTAVHHTGKKGPITLTSCGLRTADCGDGFGLSWRALKCPSEQTVMFAPISLADCVTLVSHALVSVVVVHVVVFNHT